MGVTCTIFVAFAGVFLPDLLHEGSFRRRILHNCYSVIVGRDRPGNRPVVFSRHLFIAMDLFALRYWKPSTWSRRNLSCYCGTADRHRSRLFIVPRSGPPRHSDRDRDDYSDLRRPMACWRRGGDDPPAFRGEGDRSRSRVTGAGHHRGTFGPPPLAMYLLPLGLSKVVYAGTTSIFFTVGDANKGGAVVAAHKADRRSLEH